MRFPQSLRDTAQTSPGKLDRLPRTPAGYTGLALDGYGLRDQPPARPTKPASYPVPVRQVAVLIHASFRHPLARVPLRFTNPSPPSGWIEDFHSQAIEHAGHTARLERGALQPEEAGPSSWGSWRRVGTLPGSGPGFQAWRTISPGVPDPHRSSAKSAPASATIRRKSSPGLLQGQEPGSTANGIKRRVMIFRIR